MPHISFSELKNWNKCSWYHKLNNIEKIKGFKGNEFTAFGTAIHSVCEALVQAVIKDQEAPEYFLERFAQEIKTLPSDVPIREGLVNSMREQGTPLTKYILPALEDYFDEYEVVAVEEKIYEPIGDLIDSNTNHHDFKGYIDLVLKTKDGKYHIIDWKSCSWGWDAKRKTEKITTYQLTLYKKFFAIKHGIDPDKIETHFALLKRTAKKNNAELFRVSSGKIKTQNAIKLLEKALYNINEKRYIKNRLSCTGCDFFNTQHCT